MRFGLILAIGEIIRNPIGNLIVTLFILWLLVKIF